MAVPINAQIIKGSWFGKCYQLGTGTEEAQVEDILIGCVTKTNNTFTEPMKNDTCTITFLQ